MNLFAEHLSSVELAWAAGFFDGEGTTVLADGGRPRDYPTPRCSIGQHAPEGEQCSTLIRFWCAVGMVGTITGPHKYTDAYKTPRWQWHTNKADEALVVLQLLWPYLSQPKRSQAQQVVDAFRADSVTRRAYTRKPVTIHTNSYY